MARPDPARAFYVVPDGSWDGPTVAALKALGRGEARPDQQVAAMNYIIETLCGTYDLPWRPDDRGGERESSFAAGRMFVGLQIRRAIAQPFEVLTGRSTSSENA